MHRSRPDPGCRAGHPWPKAAVAGITLVLLLALYAASAGARMESRLMPPVIHETFERLPCPSDAAEKATTIGTLGCLRQQILKSDARIDQRVKVIFRKLYDAKAKRRFIAAERSWLAYRNILCGSVADVLRGGSAQPLLLARCMLDENRQHFKELAALYAQVLRR